MSCTWIQANPSAAVIKLFGMRGHGSPYYSYPAHSTSREGQWEV